MGYPEIPATDKTLMPTSELHTSLPSLAPSPISSRKDLWAQTRVRNLKTEPIEMAQW